MKKIAIYVRVSTLEQAEHGYSVSEQTRRLKNYCEIKDWTIYDVFVDGGFSGASLDRPALKKLLGEVEHYDGVLVYKLDRLSRSQKDTLYLIEDVFNKNNVGFVSLNENLDTSTAFGKAMIGILSVFAQLEREQIAERMSMGKLGRAKAGKAVSWTEIARPYGYRIENDIYQVVPHEGKIVKDIFERYLNGESISTLYLEFTAKKIDGKNWHHSTISRILQNPIYYGGIRFKGEVYDGQHDPIITKEVFDDAQLELGKRLDRHNQVQKGTRPFQSKYILSGLLRCGKCGCPLVISHSGRRSNGTSNKYYKCQSRVKSYRIKHGINHACGDDIYQKTELETIVFEEIRKLNVDPIEISNNNDSSEIVHTKHYENEIGKLEKQYDKLTDLYLDSLIEKEDYVVRQEAINSKKMYFEKEMERINDNEKSNRNNKMRISKLLSFSERLDEIDQSQKKNLLNELIEYVSVEPHEVTITWNFNV